jgi:hypothetical protein
VRPVRAPFGVEHERVPFSTPLHTMLQLLLQLLAAPSPTRAAASSLNVTQQALSVTQRALSVTQQAHPLNTRRDVVRVGRCHGACAGSSMAMTDDDKATVNKRLLLGLGLTAIFCAAALVPDKQVLHSSQRGSTLSPPLSLPSLLSDTLLWVAIRCGPSRPSRVSSIWSRCCVSKRCFPIWRSPSPPLTLPPSAPASPLCCACHPVGSPYYPRYPCPGVIAAATHHPAFILAHAQSARL